MYPSIETIKAILVRESYISEEDSLAAEGASQNSTEYVDYLIREELLTKTLLGQALAEAYEIPFADFQANPASQEMVTLIPEALARSSRLVFVKASDQEVTVASDTPDKIDTDQLAGLFPDKEVHLAYTLPEFVDASFSHFEQTLETRFSKIIGDGNRIAPELIDEIIKDSLTYHASDIHFEPLAEEVLVRFRVDGNLREAGRLPKQYYENVLNRLKVESGMRIDEHLQAQDGALQRTVDNRVVDLRVSLVPTVQGEKVVTRVLGAYVQDYNLADIGLDDSHREMLEAAAAKPFGMILTTGPTGSGKTTTLYSLLKLLDRPNVNITSIEDPVEYKIPGINQIQVREQSNMTFAKGLRAVVRQDPDIILVGEIRDQETAEISVNAALTGHLLLSTFHANDAATAIPRLIDMGIEPFLLASTLEIIVAQRLVRRICSHCRYSLPIATAIASLPPSSQRVAEFFNEGDSAYAGKGCNVCSGSGYSGRTALFEFIQITPELQDLIIKGPSTREITALSHSQGARPMFDDGIQKVKSGQTTLAEVVRVVAIPPANAGNQPSAMTVEKPVDTPNTLQISVDEHVEEPDGEPKGE